MEILKKEQLINQFIKLNIISKKKRTREIYSKMLRLVSVLSVSFRISNDMSYLLTETERNQINFTAILINVILIKFISMKIKIIKFIKCHITIELISKMSSIPYPIFIKRYPSKVNVS